MEHSAKPGFRSDIEGLRAIAVVLVVLFHAEVPNAAGGFIGVDVFFVLSGFLITRLLLAEHATSGRIALGGFWARRARRLLPAASLTLVATVIASAFVMSPLQQRTVATDGLFSALFLANFRFAETLGDYFANQLAETSPSPFLHFWSLAVEEQFYLFWPVAVLVVLGVGRGSKRVLLLATSALFLASLAVALWMTDARPTEGFYLLPPRMFELLAGAILAIVGSARFERVNDSLRGVVGWAGIAAIAAATVSFSEATPFPGSAALVPVLGTAGIIVSGTGVTARFGPQRLLAAQPLQWLGRHSYAIYLWHWPALVLYEVEADEPSAVGRAVVVAVSIVIAAASTRLVEDPIRTSLILAARTWRGLAVGGVSIAASLVAVGLLSGGQPDLSVGEAAPSVTLVDPTVTTTQPPAVAAVDEPSDQATPTTTAAPPDDTGTLEVLETEMTSILERAATRDEVPSNLRPSLEDAARDTAQVYFDRCITPFESAEVLDCRYGVDGADFTIVLFGDSHAAHWFPAIEQIALDRGMELVVLLKGACPVADVPSTRADLIETCPAWRTAALETLVDAEPNLVIAASLSGYTTDETAWEAGLRSVLMSADAASHRVVLMLDTPRQEVSPPLCLSENLTTATSCVGSRAAAVNLDRAAAERAAATAAGVEIIDPVGWLCTSSVCPVIVGDALMYRDIDHLSTSASRLLVPLLDAALFPTS